jgi:ribosome-binding factor A
MMPDLSSVLYSFDSRDKPEQVEGLALTAAGLFERCCSTHPTKRVPTLIFELDDLLERGSRIETILKEDEEKPALPEPPAE